MGAMMRDRFANAAAYVIAAPFIVAFGVGAAVALMVLWAFGLQVSWNWLAVPYLHLPRLSFAGACAVSTIGALFRRVPTKIEREKTPALERWSLAVACPLVVIGMAWLVRTWFGAQ